MKRRDFIKSSLATSTLAAMVCPAGSEAAESSAPREFFEVRGYTLKSEKQRLADDYLRQAFIPALKRFGVGPVGVFQEIPQTPPAGKAPPPPPAGLNPSLFVLIRYSSLDQIAAVAERLEGDKEYQAAGEAYLRAPASDPVYERIESSLLRAFAAMPKLEAPEKKSRIFQLRIYESCSEAASKKKIEMFNTAEIAIFRRCGMNPVFFGEALVGLRLPNLTYMLTFADDDAKKAAWDKFRVDPEWLKLRAMPEYADKLIVSKITNRVLAPTDYSEI